MSMMQRFVKRALSIDSFLFHVIDVDGELCVSCGDLAALIWNKEEDYLFLRLQFKKYHLPIFKLFASSNSVMFYQIKKFGVKGVKGFNKEAELRVFPLTKMVEVLDLLGHPSVHVRNIVQLELKNFSYSNPVWMEFHEGAPDLHMKGNAISLSEESKLERLCLADLITMKERLAAQLARNPNADESIRLRGIIHKICERIPQVVKICGI